MEIYSRKGEIVPLFFHMRKYPIDIENESLVHLNVTFFLSFFKFAVIYASNYDNVSRPCSATAAGFQPEIGYKSVG